jgi:hypothetical protein
MKLTNREQDYLNRMRERCDILRARVGDGTQHQHYVHEWKRELKALLWAITRIEDSAT